MSIDPTTGVSIGRDHAMLISKDIKVGVHSSASRGKTRVTENTLQDLSQVSICSTPANTSGDETGVFDVNCLMR